MEQNAIVDLEGLWVPIVTPFKSDGSLDEASLASLAARLLADGVDGLIALGTTGEPSTMTADERRRTVAICDGACQDAGRPLMVGAGTNSTAGTIEEIDFLTEGAQVLAALVVVPYYTRPSQQEVIEHFGIVADESPVPLVAYNIPYRTGRGLDAAALLELSAHPNIIGLKQAVGGLDLDTLQVLRGTDPGFAVLAGDDAFTVPTMLMGGSGAIAAAAHVCTPQFVEMVAAAQSGTALDVARAVSLAHELLAVVQAGFAEPSPAVWKAALAERSEIASDHVRRPLTAASRDAAERLLTACR